jgi:hypothetical protein
VDGAANIDMGENKDLSLCYVSTVSRVPNTEITGTAPPNAELCCVGSDEDFVQVEFDTADGQKGTQAGEIRLNC